MIPTLEFKFTISEYTETFEINSKPSSLAKVDTLYVAFYTWNIPLRSLHQGSQPETS